MLISDYVKNYTSGRRISFWRVLVEVEELFAELVRGNGAGIREEWGDVVHFVQMWCYWRFGIDGSVWDQSQNSVDKFKGRKIVWQEIYAYVGLDRNVSNYVGNYKKPEKVVQQLALFGVSEAKAREAYERIVLKRGL